MTRDLFSGDSRAVAPAIGFILFIGILVLLLSVYQAHIIPQQNAETELEHHQETRNELRALDNAISAVGSDEKPRFETINLGTAYEDRTLGINPPPPAGTIRTEEHNISIANESGTQTNIPTQFIEYQPGYNELDIGSTWYEHSVLYLDERDRGNSLNVIEDQQIVQDGNATVVALQNEFQETGTGRVTLELYPQNGVNNVTLPEEDGNYTVDIPTRLNGSEYWNEAIGAADIYRGVDKKQSNGEPYLLNLSVEPDRLEIDSVGIQLDPTEEATTETEKEEAAEALVVEEEDGELIGQGSTGEAGRFRFDIKNSGNATLDIIAIGIINTTSSDAEEVSGDPSFRQGRGNDRKDLIEETINFDNNTDGAERFEFNEEVRTNPDQTRDRFEFNRFRDQDGNNAGMKGETINIRVWAKNEDGDISRTDLELKDD